MTHTIKRHTAHTDSPYSGAPLVFIGKEYTGVIRGAPGTNQPMCGSFVVVSLFSSSSIRAAWAQSSSGPMSDNVPFAAAMGIHTGNADRTGSAEIDKRLRLLERICLGVAKDI